jgi:hypothetical protein
MAYSSGTSGDPSIQLGLSWEDLNMPDHNPSPSRSSLTYGRPSSVGTPSVFKRETLKIKADPNPPPEISHLRLPSVDELNRA